MQSATEAACEVWFGKFIAVDEIAATRLSDFSGSAEAGEYAGIRVVPRQLVEMETPETIYERREIFESLSQEAKQVLTLVLESPVQVLSTISCDVYKGKAFSTTKLRRLMHNRLHLKWPQVNRVVKELKGVMRTL